MSKDIGSDKDIGTIKKVKKVQIKEIKEKKPKNPYYVNNNELREELIKSKELDDMTPRALELCTLIAQRMSSKLMYTQPEDREDCIATAIMDCYMYWRNYNPEKSLNAFSYISSICLNGYAKNWRKFGKLNFPDSKCIRLATNKIYSL